MPPPPPPPPPPPQSSASLDCNPSSSSSSSSSSSPPPPRRLSPAQTSNPQLKTHVHPSLPLPLSPSLPHQAVATPPSKSNALPHTLSSPLTTSLSLSSASTPTPLSSSLLNPPPQPHLIAPLLTSSPSRIDPSISPAPHFESRTRPVLAFLFSNHVSIQISQIAVTVLGIASSSKPQFSSYTVVDLGIIKSRSKAAKATFSDFSTSSCLSGLESSGTKT
ncbi:hypothetical protein TEA_022877 [Camellia sinensis var. sinensis]|uniref:Uncharacterized protein n=1 Tax=Camellia sinensis var. sinensis TaxID=542762 RepID=A0A4S4DUK1_CAMSN|nr:hypothetical protein TEA_022877 [Camellia sinensis var. sinensis]